MTREELVASLKYTMKKHKNDIVLTFDTNISLMCKDILDYLEQEPCEDAVSRTEVFEIIEQIDVAGGFIGYNTYSEAFERVRNLPSVKLQEPKTGQWIVYDSGNYNGKWSCCFCDNCRNYYTRDWREMNYCPNCGAKMESEEN